MIIRLTKAKNQSKQDILACLRDDGSRTWWPLPPHFAEHDLLHYAVETTLGLTHAFFGLIESGRDIGDFGTRDGQKDFYPPQAIQAEFLVGLLQVEMRDNTLPDNDEFLAALALTAEKVPGLSPLSVTADDLDTIRATMNQLSQQWRSLPAGEAMEWPFP